MQLESVLIQNLDLAAHPQLLRTGQSWPKPCVFTEMLRKQEGWTFLGLYGNTHSREQLGSHHGLPAHRAAHLSRLIIHPEYLYCSLAHPLLGRWIAISHLSQKKTIKGNWKRQHYFFYFFFFLLCVLQFPRGGWRVLRALQSPGWQQSPAASQGRFSTWCFLQHCASGMAQLSGL